MIKHFFVLLLLISFSFGKTPSLETMIGQMIMVGIGGDKPSDKWVKQLAFDIQKGRVGGVILFANNIENPKKLKKLTSYLKNIKTEQPLFVAIDQEGGEVQRLNKKNGFNSYPSAFDVSRKKTLLEAYDIYKNLASELKDYGFNLNFAPVVDLNINENSPAIGAKKRSYSDKEEIVIAYSSEFIKAQKEAGIISVLKHFPGHGSALSDSHKHLTDVSNTWDYKELKPYYDFVKYDKTDAIMVGHINLKIFDKIYPASLSKNMINGLLREKLKFNGVVFSDDMKMKAISDIYGFEKSVILAVNAGVNVLVYSSYFTKKSSVIKEVTQIITDAVKSGDIDKKLIEDSYKKIVRLKNGID
jgi:beta-N-acetylhexosaminidase